MPEDALSGGPPADSRTTTADTQETTSLVPVPEGLEPPCGHATSARDPEPAPTSMAFAGDDEPTLPNGVAAVRASPRTPNAGTAETAAGPRTRPETHILLALLTFLAAMWAHLTPSRPTDYWGELLQAATDPVRLTDALTFAGALMLILLAHEVGHRVAARLSGVETSLPYFIPAPTLLGTLGAVITMRRPPENRGALLRVGITGPLFGLAVALPLAAWGLAASEPIAIGDVDPSRPFAFGSSLLFDWLRGRYAPLTAAGLDLHPVAFAAWVGLFITSINLVPAAQLDGGHIAYALFGRAARRVSAAFVIGLFATGLILGLSGPPGQPNWGGAIWIFWALLLFVVGLEHPAVRDPHRSLTWGQRAAGWSGLFILAITFVPVPVTFIPTLPVTHPRAEQPAPELHEGDTTYQAEEFEL